MFVLEQYFVTTASRTNSLLLRQQNYFAETKIFTKIRRYTWSHLSLQHIATMLSQNCKGLVNFRGKLHKRLHHGRLHARVWCADIHCRHPQAFPPLFCCASFRTKCGIENKILVGITQDVTNLFYV